MQQKILKGARPGNLPVKHPGKYYLTLNSSAAKKNRIEVSARNIGTGNECVIIKIKHENGGSDVGVRALSLC